MLFLGGYLLDYTFISYIFYQIGFEGIEFFNNSLIEGMIYGLILGIKSSAMIFIFIWVRASFPRIRFDQLMSFSWTILLPVVIAIIILIPCIVYSFQIIPSNINLL